GSALIALLARFTVRIDDRPRAGERCRLAAWRTGADGRKHAASSAAYGEDGRLLAIGDALWVEPRRPPEG
ncbi:MAG: hypothetical protein MI723_05760, partial [Caulobacterales bacterium]|nr:hypothetical protein [Caulobacterales bacterium]